MKKNNLLGFFYNSIILDYIVLECQYQSTWLEVQLQADCEYLGGSVLEPLLINIFTNDLKEETKYILNKIADYIKLGQGGSQGAELSLRETQEGWRNGPTGISGNSTRASARSCSLDRPIPCNNRDWGPGSWGAGLMDRVWGCWQTPNRAKQEV